MDYKKMIYPIIVGLVIIAVTYYIADMLGKNKYTSTNMFSVDTVWVKSDTIYVDKFIRAKQIPAHIDTVTIEVDGQSVTTEVSISDTVAVIDSSRIWARYYGMPYNFFDISADIHEKVVTKTVYMTKTVGSLESFWDKFGLSLQTGAGYGLINRKPDIYIGAGIHFKLK